MPEPFVFRWETDTARYRDLATGRFVAQDAILDWCQQSIDASENVTDMLARYVSDGTVSPGDWERLMRQEIKEQYIAEYIAGRGGREQMTARDWGSIGGQLKNQYKYLRRFRDEVAAGKLSEAQIRVRAGMYVQSSWQARERGYRRAVLEAGYDEVRWVLDPSPEVEHCVGCLAFEALGWQKVDKWPFTQGSNKDCLPTSGCTPCLVSCRCHLEYRRSEEVEE